MIIHVPVYVICTDEFCGMTPNLGDTNPFSIRQWRKGGRGFEWVTQDRPATVTTHTHTQSQLHCFSGRKPNRHTHAEKWTKNYFHFSGFLSQMRVKLITNITVWFTFASSAAKITTIWLALWYQIISRHSCIHGHAHGSKMSGTGSHFTHAKLEALVLSLSSEKPPWVPTDFPASFLEAITCPQADMERGNSYQHGYVYVWRGTAFARLSFQGQSSCLSSCVSPLCRFGNAFQKSNFKSIFRSLFVSLDTLDSHFLPPPPTNHLPRNPPYQQTSEDSLKKPF